MPNVETKSCTQCMAEIPAAAKKCRHCGSRQEPALDSFAKRMLGALLIGVLLFAIGLANEGGAADAVRAIGGLTAILSGVLILRALLKAD